jgi:hypothetical protein
MRRWLLLLACLAPGCQLVPGNGGEVADDVEPPVVAPAAELGSVALTASCVSSEEDEIQAVQLVGSYDCEEKFTVTLTNSGSEQLGSLQAQMTLAEVDPEGEIPVPGPTPTGTEQSPEGVFTLASVDAEGASCEAGPSRVLCELEPLPDGESAEIILQISPGPQQATVTTEVILAEA